MGVGVGVGVRGFEEMGVGLLFLDCKYMKFYGVSSNEIFNFY